MEVAAVLYFKPILSASALQLSWEIRDLPIEHHLEKLKHQKYVAEKKLTAAKHREKQLQHELKQLTRSERTHRLCTRAGMLETFLREPTLLTDDDVMELLTFVFHGEAVQKKLNMLIEKRKETEQPDGG